MSTSLVVIPARGGSKGIPKKNMRSIGGKPLITWSIEHALQASCVDRVIVTTDSEEIAELAEAAGAEVPFIRPTDISTDVATTESAISHALDWLKVNQDYVPKDVILLQPTSPFRESGAVDRAYDSYKKGGFDSMLSVAEFWHFLWKDGQSAQAMYDYKNRPRRQDIPTTDVKFKENGSIYLFGTEGFLRNNNRLFGCIGLFCMSELESFEIDTEVDWAIVEAILSTKYL